MSKLRFLKNKLFLYLFLALIQAISCFKGEVLMAMQVLENSDTVILEKTRHYQNVVQPFFQAVPVQFMEGARKAKIAYKSFLQKKSETAHNLILATGYNESFLKYKEVIYDLFQAGYNVWVYDHRGQGLSQRFIEDKTKSYVDDFASMVDDLGLMVSQIRSKFASSRIFGIGHSMGGAVLSAGIDKLSLDGMVLLAPMYKLPVLSEGLYRSVFGAMIYFGFSEFVIKTSDRHKRQSFETNGLTSSKFRFTNWSKESLGSEGLYLRQMSVNWIHGALGFSQKIRTGGFKTASDVHTPTLLVQAELDTIVDNSGHDEFLEHYPRVKKITIPQAKHELLMEVDPIRSRVLSEVFAFLKIPRIT